MKAKELAKLLMNTPEREVYAIDYTKDDNDLIALEEVYQEEYDDAELDNSVILSINGNLFYLNHIKGEKRWNFTRTNDNFICAGSPCSEVRTLLYYDENIGPQTILDTLVKVTNTVNTNLFKIENISYE